MIITVVDLVDMWIFMVIANLLFNSIQSSSGVNIIITSTVFTRPESKSYYSPYQTSILLSLF